VRVVFADDEAPARRALARILAGLGVEVVGEAASAEAALVLVARTAPDVLLLDVHMPGLGGLALAAREALPPVVFVTADAGEALAAFDVGAADYVLKPVRPERLAAALARAAGRAAVPRVVSVSRGEVRAFDARAPVRYRSADKYTAFVVDGVEHLTEEPLVALEARLASHGFVRVHRAELVRLDAVRALVAGDDGLSVALADGQHAPVSRRYASGLRGALRG
jgi:DNA-binding LytR/AlgR family response regulator